jgi:hypothetical protein
VQSDVTTSVDGGGAGNPWTDATGYALQFGVSTGANNKPFQLEKRTTSNTSLLGSSGAYTAASTGGGSGFALANTTSYVVLLNFKMVSSSQMDVTGTLMQGTTVLGTQTVSDLGTSFGGTAIGSGLLTGSQGLYTNFDQLYFRNADASQESSVAFSEWKVDYTPAAVPEASSVLMVGLIGIGGLAVRRFRRSKPAETQEAA